jgi:hypothetical protein
MVFVALMAAGRCDGGLGNGVSGSGLFFWFGAFFVGKAGIGGRYSADGESGGACGIAQ